MKNKTIKVDLLARVEGEGGLFIKVKENRVTEVQLKIFEPPRFFEAFLRGRGFQEASDITSRICGIIPDSKGRRPWTWSFLSKRGSPGIIIL